ncbi:DNA-binding domain-containing protein [Psychromarinibacter sp. C21-152]|uniref:DNA-binding domain-containing protein n=1 Tax=Psychromarinibacter sediminicola TaxID=3033385 RepID=A0AAE3NLN6_9RHOB|nr:DNA-binding domain-containing protein [Psychromarinibacter sediminicola]MDF0600123.1 DNA-binding domain-containing protein [Psychromarinibacter sediminicola]
MSVTQTDFTRAVFDPGQAVPPGLTNPDGAAATKRFDVYRNNVAVSLTEALETAFPLLRKLVGSDNFRRLAGAYLRAHPPTSPLMMHYGQEMPQFLENFGPLRRLGYLPDVARLELALRGSYHAADATPLAPETLQDMPADRLMAARLRLAPAVRLVRSRWPIHGIWRFNMTDDAPKPESRGENVLITRPDFDPAPHLLPPGGGTFVAAVLQGESFGAAYEAAVAQVAEFDLPGLLSLLLGGGAIAGLDEGDQE